MIVLLNLKSKRLFVEMCFDKDSKVTRDIMTIMRLSKSYPKNQILNIYCNMFLDEYKQVFVSNKIDDLFILNNEKFTQVNTEGLDLFSKCIYKKLLRIIFDLDFTYEHNFLMLNNYDEDNMPISKIIIKLVKQSFVQALIRIVISKEKFLYLNNSAEEDFFEKAQIDNFEFLFLKNIISRGFALTKQKYGDNYTCLFRKDEIYDDVVKYFFFMFGNSLVIKSFGKH
jgi:hypothetical protein